VNTSDAGRSVDSTSSTPMRSSRCSDPSAAVADSAVPAIRSLHWATAAALAELARYDPWKSASSSLIPNVPPFDSRNTLISPDGRYSQAALPLTP
jgi:hypothetical protein